MQEWFSRIDQTIEADYSQFRGLQCAHRNNHQNWASWEVVKQKPIHDLNLVVSPEYHHFLTALVIAVWAKVTNAWGHSCPQIKLCTHCTLSSNNSYCTAKVTGNKTVTIFGTGEGCLNRSCCLWNVNVILRHLALALKSKCLTPKLSLCHSIICRSVCLSVWLVAGLLLLTEDTYYQCSL